MSAVEAAGGSRLRRLRSTLLAEWREIGGLGRLALVGVAASLIVTIALGFSITTSTRRHLLHARTELLSLVVDELAAHPAAPLTGTGDLAAFDDEARLRLVGGETVRVKLWDRNGTIVYSDAGELIGERFALSDAAEVAFLGEPTSKISDLTEPAHAEHRDLGSLIEFYIPFGGGPGLPAGVFEVEQRLDTLNEALSQVARNVWLSIGGGLLALGTFLGALGLARARDLNRRRRQAERLLGDVLHVQEEERRRIVGSLHDDIGQRLYRLLYGLDGSRSRLAPDHAVAAELKELEGVVREIDDTLRAELRLLHQGLAADVGLASAIEGLAERTEAESGIGVEVDVELAEEPDPVPRTALFRAAEEALLNVRKHAGASRVSLRVAERGDEVVLDVVDDGGGNGAGIAPGIGLTTNRERLEAIGGGLEVSTLRGRGTRFRAWVPKTGVGP